MGNVKRQQHVESESQVNTRQDRNIYLTDGGTLEWSSGTLSWSSNLRLRRAGKTRDIISASSIVVGLGGGSTLYVDVDRDLGGQVLTPFAGSSGATDNSNDTRIILGTVGVDGKFYWRNGTVMSEGDSKVFGTLNSVIDRKYVVALDGQILYNTTPEFEYVVGSGQLAVFVGGLLMVEGVHYTENDTTSILFFASSQPGGGEEVLLVNLAGGQGPAGASGGSLQQSYDAGREILTTDDSSPLIIETPGDDAEALRINSAGGDPRFQFDNRNGLKVIQGSTYNPGIAIDPDALLGSWRLHAIPDGSGDLMLLAPDALGLAGIRMAAEGQGLEWGSFIGDPTDTGSWVGAGSIAWSVIELVGTAGSTVSIGTSLDRENVLGAALAFIDPVSDRTILLDNTDPPVRDFVVYMDDSGVVHLAGTPFGGGLLQDTTVRFALFYEAS